MKKNKTKNPLIKRVPRELKGDWSKYLLVSLFMIFVIGFISGMYGQTLIVIISAL